MIATCIRVVLLLSVISMLNSCGSLAPNKNNNGGTLEASTANAGIKTLRLWFYFEGKERFLKIKALTDGYSKLHPNIRIEPVYVPFNDFKKRISIAMATSDLPDIIILDNPDLASYAARGVLADISGQLKDWPDKAEFFEGPWKSVTYNGGEYGIPLGSNNLALYYNENMLAAAGVHPPQTWDDLKKTAIKLSKKGITGLGISANSNEEGTFQFLPWLLSAGGSFDHIDGTEGKKAFGLLAELVRSGAMSKDVINWTQADLMRQFASGQVAMMINGSWQLPELALISPDLKFGVARIPKEVRNASALGGENMGVIQGEHTTDAVEFAKYVASPEVIKPFLQSFGYFPARKDVMNDPYWMGDPKRKVFAEAMQYAQPRGPHPNWPQISKAISDAVVETVTQHSLPEEAAAKAQKKINAILINKVQ